MKRREGKLSLEDVKSGYDQYIEREVKGYHWTERRWAKAILDFIIRNEKNN